MNLDELVIQAQMDAVNHLNIDRLDDIEGRYNFKGITRHDANLLIQAVRGLHRLRRELESTLAAKQAVLDAYMIPDFAALLAEALRYTHHHRNCEISITNNTCTCGYRDLVDRAIAAKRAVLDAWEKEKHDE